jgi:uncharacterized Zn finger protein (UPF0148 family)
MADKTCPKCGIPYSGSKITRCLLCGAVLTSNQQVTEPSPVEAQVTKEEAVPLFDDKGGFSKKNKKKDLVIGQLQADKEALEKRLNTFEEIYKKEHPEPKPWYADVGKWLVLLLVLGMIYLIYWFCKSQGGLPHEFYELLRRFKL